jgi:hypothetical protein
VVAQSSLADALSPLLLLAHSLGITLPPWFGLVCRQPLRCCILFPVDFVGRSRVVEAVALCFSFSCPYIYSRSLISSFVICDMCYEGSLVAVSCNSLYLMKNGLYSPIAKKGIGKSI